MKIIYIFLLIPVFCFSQVTQINGMKIYGSDSLVYSGDITYELRHAEYVGDTITYEPELDEDVWLKIAPGWTVTEAKDITAVKDSITIITNGSYFSIVEITFSAGNNEDYELGIFKNNVLIHTVYGTGDGAGNRRTMINFKYLDGLVAGDDLSVKIRNTSSNNDPTIKMAYWYIRKEY